MMKQGSLAEQYIKEDVIRVVTKRDDRLTTGPGIGNDYAVFGNLVTADGIGNTPALAWIKALNNFACSGGNPEQARILMVFSNTVKSSGIKSSMEEFDRLADIWKVQLVGGHSEITKDCGEAVFYVTLFGQKKEYIPSKKAVKPGCDIVMVGYAGGQAANYLIKKYSEILAGRFSKRFLEEAKTDEISLALYDTVQCALKEAGDRIYYMHDASRGGIYTALWQLGSWTGRGFLIENGAIPIKQQTIEICEALDRNPYLADSTGCLLLVCEKGRPLAEALKPNGFEARIIGRITDDKERLVRLTPQDIRTLSPADGDEIYLD